MPQYRKKPIVIEAIQWNPETKPRDLPDWLKDVIFDPSNLDLFITGTGELILRTLEGDMKAQVGDWIIKGVKNELYPCKPDIFAATYEAV